VEFFEQPATRETLQNAERKGRAANAAAGNAERGAFLPQARDGRGPERAQAGFRVVTRDRIAGGKVAVQLLKLALQDFVQLQAGAVVFARRFCGGVSRPRWLGRMRLGRIRLQRFHNADRPSAADGRSDPL
jgi:hypothetical protein